MLDDKKEAMEGLEKLHFPSQPFFYWIAYCSGTAKFFVELVGCSCSAQRLHIYHMRNICFFFELSGVAFRLAPQNAEFLV